MISYLIAFELIPKQRSIVRTHGGSNTHLITREVKETSVPPSFSRISFQ